MDVVVTAATAAAAIFIFFVTTATAATVVTAAAVAVVVVAVVVTAVIVVTAIAILTIITIIDNGDLRPGRQSDTSSDRRMRDAHLLQGVGTICDREGLRRESRLRRESDIVVYAERDSDIDISYRDN